jgi:hypothetical protein
MGQIFGIPDPLPDFIPFVNRKFLLLYLNLILFC